MNLLDLFIDYKVIDAKLKPEEKLENKRFEDLFTVYVPRFTKQEENPVKEAEKPVEQQVEEPKTNRMSIEERINYFKSRKDKKQNNILEESNVINDKTILQDDYQESIEKPEEDRHEFDLNNYFEYLGRKYSTETVNIKEYDRNLPKWTPINENNIFTKNILEIQNNNKDNYKYFREQLEYYAKKHNLNSETIDVLDAIAALESNYNIEASNKNSSALGWFQFLDGTRSQYTKLSRDRFTKDPQAQIDAAVKHYKYLQNRLKKVKNVHNIQLTPLQKMYAAWWNPGSLENYYKTGADDFQTNSDKMDLYKIIKKAS